MSSREWNKVPEIGEKSLDCIENEFKFEKMTPVQAAAIPLFLSHRDVLVQACTGSGKTIAFLLPIFEILSNLEDPLKSFEIGALILSPTRELATQIYQVAQRFAMENYFSNIKILLLVGGSGHEEDIIALNESAGANIVIGTPGRIEAALTKTNLPISTKRLEMLVMDEADRLLDMGFQVSLNNILRILPKQRRTGLFSATMTSDLHELAKAGLRNPATIHVKVKSKNGNADTGDQSIPIGLANFYEIVPVKNKLVYLLDFLTSHQENKVIVFVLTKAQVDYFGALLSNSVVDLDQSAVFCIHGSMPQKKRNSVYSKFRDCPKGVLLCTDLVARGVDIPEVDWILQFDPPQDPSYFIHRVGRTARMGKKGSALVLLDPTEDTYIEFLRIKKVPMIQFREKELEVLDLSRDSILEKVKNLQMKDRDLMDKAQKAFVSFVRGYKEHQCNYIFQWNKLDYGCLAEGLGLLFFPRMPDLKHLKVEFSNSPVDKDSIPYKDKIREKHRLENLESTQQKRAEIIQSRKSAYLKREKAKKEATRLRNKRNKSQTQDLLAEWNELAEETRLIKKLKRGKNSKDQLDLSSSDDLESAN